MATFVFSSSFLLSSAGTRALFIPLLIKRFVAVVWNCSRWSAEGLQERSRELRLHSSTFPPLSLFSSLSPLSRSFKHTHTHTIVTMRISLRLVAAALLLSLCASVAVAGVAEEEELDADEFDLPAAPQEVRAGRGCVCVCVCVRARRDTQGRGDVQRWMRRRRRGRETRELGSKEARVASPVPNQ